MPRKEYPLACIFLGAPVKPDNDGNRAGRANNSRKERADKDRECEEW